MQKKIQELENHINLLVGEISLLKAEIKSKSNIEHAETLANEAKGLAVMAEASARSAMDAFENLEFKEFTYGQARVHEYDKGKGFFVGSSICKSQDKLVSSVYSDDSRSTLTIIIDK